MPSQGPNNPATGADDNAVGFTTWTNPGNIVSSNDSRATTSTPGASTSHYLKATDFGFSIPGTATIDGIEVGIERNGTLGTDNIVRLVKAGVVVGDNKAAVDVWPGADAYATYGGVADLWGTTWTPADVNVSNFGVVLSASLSGAGTVSVDHVRITVTYTEAAFDVATVPYLPCPPPRVERRVVVAY